MVKGEKCEKETLGDYRGFPGAPQKGPSYFRILS